MSLIERRRGMMGAKHIPLPPGIVLCEYIEAPTDDPKDAAIILPQIMNDFDEVTIDMIVYGTYYDRRNSIVFTAGSESGGPSKPYCGITSSGFKQNGTYDNNMRQTWNWTRTQSSGNKARIGAWTDNIFSTKRKYYEVTLLKEKKEIADYFPARSIIHDSIGVYDFINGIYVEQQSGLIGYSVGPDVKRRAT